MKLLENGNKKVKEDKSKSYTMSDMYLAFKSQHPNIKITKPKFREICEEYYMAISEAMVFNALTLKLPGHLGELKIVTSKTNFNNLKPDWNATKKVLESKGLTMSDLKENKDMMMYHLNGHSNNRHCKIYWKKGKVLNISIYYFKFTRDNSRMMSAAMKDNKLFIP